MKSRLLEILQNKPQAYNSCRKSYGKDQVKTQLQVDQRPQHKPSFTEHDRRK